ncbi:MAG: SUMF1/EgtB/PvdO family nonheme iron enzyme [Cyanobacteria bacterium P01_F01_bin.143]
MGKNWAIAVGINKYENLSSLKYAKHDAEAIADWLRQEAKFDEVFLFTEDSPAINKTNPPIPTSPTYGHLRRFLRAQFENIKRPLLKPEDNLWFFFAGHGLRHRDKDYLMLCDSDPGDVEHTAIAVEYVTQRLRRSGADNVVLFLDACRDQGSRGVVGIGKQHQGVITFYSCTANQKSWEFDELQHGSFTHALLEGLRIQGEANCATVERLDQYLRYSVPQLNDRYGKGFQNPYLKAEPPYKMYFILLEQFATLKDVEPLKYQASLAENEDNLLLAEQLWIRILAVSRGDLDAIAAIQRIAVKKVSQPQNSPQEPVISTLESANLPREAEVETSQANIQREQERIRQQLEEAKLIQQQREIQRKRQQQKVVTTSSSITRQQFLKWAGFGSTGLVTAFVISEIFKESPSPSLLPTKSPQLPASEPNLNSTTTPISLTELDSFNFETVTVDQDGEIFERSDKQAKFFKEDLGNGVILEMVYIPGGKFLMGTEDEEIERLEKKFNIEWVTREKPQHKVTVQPFFMGKFQITQTQWKTIASLPQIKRYLYPEPSRFKGDHLPVEQVSWEEAVEFCQRLSKLTRKEYRLPSEAEWEYACRAGTTTPFNFGATITSNLANYRGISIYADEPRGEYREQTIQVESFNPNNFGLYDMHGNVWEWCQDNWHDNYKDAPDDGSVWFSKSNNEHIVRGGSWLANPWGCRSADRPHNQRNTRSFSIGLRIVCTNNLI